MSDDSAGVISTSSTGVSRVESRAQVVLQPLGYPKITRVWGSWNVR